MRYFRSLIYAQTELTQHARSQVSFTSKSTTRSHSSARPVSGASLLSSSGSSRPQLTLSLSTLHMDGNTRLCTATAAAAMRESFGCDGQPGSYTDFVRFFRARQNPQVLTMLFSGPLRHAPHGRAQHGGHADRPLESHPGPPCRPKPCTLLSTFLNATTSSQTTLQPFLIVMDPRCTSVGHAALEHGGIHLPARVGTNLCLLNGILKILLDNEEFHDNDWIGARSLRRPGSPSLRADVRARTRSQAHDRH